MVTTGSKAAAVMAAAGTKASTAMAAGVMVTAGSVASAAINNDFGAVVAAAGTTLLAAAAIVEEEATATAAAADIITSASASFDARMTEHPLQTLDFMLQPFRRTPLSECLIIIYIRRIKIKFCRRTVLKLIGCYNNNNSINLDLYMVLYLMHFQQ